MIFCQAVSLCKVLFPWPILVLVAVGNHSIPVVYTYDGERPNYSEDAGAIAVT